MPLFTRVEWQARTQEDFIYESNDRYEAMYGRELDNDQIEWLQIIWEEYADQDGEINWERTHDGAWYYYMSEVLGLDDDTIDRYSED